MVRWQIASGARVTLLGATLTTAAIMVALAYARLTALIVVLIVLLGVTLEAPRPVTQALVADLVPEEDRARAYAALFWVSNLGIRGSDDKRRLRGPIRVHRDLLDRRGHRFVVRRSRLVVRARMAPRLIRRDPGRVWAAGVALVGVGFALTAIASTTGGYLLSVAVWSFGEIFPATVTGAIVARLAPEELRGRYSGLYSLAVASGWLTSSLGGTQLLSVSPLVLWESCAVLSAASAYGVLRLAPRLRPVKPERPKLDG